jgi:hypothetical protein
VFEGEGHGAVGEARDEFDARAGNTALTGEQQQEGLVLHILLE